MTTLIALATKHAVVVGADSLGTETRPLVDPLRLIQYFDPNNGFRMRTNADGSPTLPDFSTVFNEAEHVPYNQLLHVNKLFHLGKLPIGAMFTGIVSIGPHTIRGLVSSFIAQDIPTRQGNRNYSVKTVTERLLKHFRHYYTNEYKQSYLEQELELLVAGYDRDKQWPTILRVDVRRNKIDVEFPAGEFGIAFAGQMDWIQRIVFGTDTQNRVNLRSRVDELLELYRARLQAHVTANGYTGDLPKPGSFGTELALFQDWDLDSLDANWGNFSEQNAIDCISFFLGVMIQAQDVSAQLPTVGGNKHIAVIRKDGFYPVTKEVWTHEDHQVSIPEVRV